MGHPELCVAWLANKLSQYGVPLKRGDRFRVMFGKLGTVTVDFE